MKTIVILSTEPWGKILLSKMHYAIELASMGYKVYFVNPPLPASKNKQLAYINAESGIEKITVIDLKAVKGILFFRHKLPFIFNAISDNYTRHICSLIPDKINEVWCFNPHMFNDLKKFNADLNLVLLYDFYKGKHVDNVIATADVLISVSKLIMDHYKDTRIPKLLLQHGLSEYFAMLAEKKIAEQNFNSEPDEKIKVGYVGNLLREGMDMNIAKKIIEEHKEKEFHFWGPYSLDNNNVTANIILSGELSEFIGFLKKQQNVFLRGVKSQQELAKEINEMDCFLFLYSSSKDVNQASNSHKILEYLSTGKAIISTFVSNYQHTDLLSMCKPGDNSDFYLLFTTVTSHLDENNSAEKQLQRISFALDNTYSKQIHRIWDFCRN